MQQKSAKFFSVGTFLFIALILIPGLTFHYPVHIEDALTSFPAPGFSVHVSGWRIVGEPVFGPLLFSLRADQPVEKFFALMGWVMFILLILSLYQGFRNRKSEKYFFLKSLSHGLVKILMVLILWIALLLILIFMPLPGNTIVNKRPGTILVNTHSHTYYSHDGLISPLKLMRWHRRNGFDAFFITDHNLHDKALEVVRAQKDGVIPAVPVVFCGEEFSGSNHITLLGLQRDFKTRGMSDSTVIDSTHANNGVAIVAHWFADKHRTIQYYIDCGADGYEIANQAEGLTYDREIFRNIVNKCKANDLLMVGACDYHGYGSACFTWNALHIPGWHEMDETGKRVSVMDLLRNHEQDKINVLLYRDRMLTNRSHILLRPVCEVVGYFRSLNRLQILSWILWILLFRSIRILLKKRRKFNPNPLRAWGIAGFFSALFVASIGFYLHSQVQPLIGYNEIFAEQSGTFLWSGLGFLLISSVVIFKSKRVIGN
ncbi:MAG TPA: hypothetical protein ENH29_04235 [Bacteroidetes bacterium]|nr:hypothetical protein [Bacteroidota bacterium]